MVTEQAVLGLGSNMGDRETMLREAAVRLSAEDGVRLVGASSIYETPPLDVPSPQEDYLNQVVVVSTRLSPARLLARCRGIEEVMGRPRNHTAGTPRTIDIDLITYGSWVSEWIPPGCDHSDLVIPHPEYTKRKFVLAPLAEVLPGFRDPRTGHSIQRLLEDCPDTTAIHHRDGLQEVPC